MPKVKVSITIDASVLERIDRLTEGSSRSERIERALKHWLRGRRFRALENEIAAYYRDQSVAEAAEDREWAEHSSRQIKKTWK